jgi:hypothetical protein
MVLEDRAPDCPRAGMEHEPEATGLASLKLEKVITAPQGAQLDAPIATFHRFQAGMAERFIGKRGGESPDGAGRGMPDRRDPLAEPCEQSRGDALVRQAIGIAIETEGRHAASNVSADGLRIDGLAGRDDHPDAHPVGEVHVGHDRDAADVFRS